MNTLPIHFAPLQGYTEAAYRNAHATFFGSVDTYYTPFVRIEKGTFRNKDIRDIDPSLNEVPHLVPQLIAPTSEKAEAILQLFMDKGYREVDLNLGCPFPLLAKRHNGSGILPFPEEVKDVLSVIKKYPQLTFSVKMRLGWEHADECMQLLPLLNEVPLRHITLHPRLGKQQYKGTIDLKGFAAFYEACSHPLIYNGDIHTREDIEQIQNLFPNLAGIMLGRGLLAHPELAWEYQQGCTLSAYEKRDKLKAMHTYIYHRYEQQIEGGEGQLLNKMKTFWEYLQPHAEKKLLKTVHKSTNLTKYNAAVAALFAGIAD